MKEILIFNGVWAAVCFLIVASVFTRKTYAVVAPPPQRDYRVRVVEAVLLAEARGDGPGGVRRVAEVIRNRMVKSGHTALTEVITPYQFSCLNDTTPDALLEHREHWPIPVDTEEMAQWCATQLVFPHGYEFGLSDLTHGATHYCVAGQVPAWARGEKPLRPTAAYKNHTFYRVP